MKQESSTIRRVPVVAIRGSVVFPHSDALLSFGRPKSISAVNSAFQEDRVVAIFTQKDPRTSEPGEDDLYKIGTIATITQMMTTDGDIHALVRGQERIRLEEIMTDEPFMVGKVAQIPETGGGTGEVKAGAK